MTVPASFRTSVALRRIRADLWLEIEGVPWAFGIVPHAGSWFAGRAAAVERRLGVADVMHGVPAGIDQEVRPLDGESTVGAYSTTLLWDSAGVLRGLVANTGRTDYRLALMAPARADSTVYALHDTVTHDDADGRSLVARCSTAGTSGATAPWPAGKAVGDTITTDTAGTLVWTVIAVAKDLEATGAETFLPYLGTADAAQYPTGGGTIYIGRETFTYSARTAGTNGAGYFSGVTRGMYPLPGRTAKTQHTWGDVITPYARFLKSRGAAVVATYDGTEAGSATRWAGSVQNAKGALRGSGLTIDMESVNSAFRARVFSGQRTGKLAAGISSPSGEYTPAAESEPAPESSKVRLVAASLKGPWNAGNTLIVRVGEEFFAGTIATDATGTYVDLSGTGARGMFSSTASQHPMGEAVKEVLWIGDYSATGTPEQRFCKFTLGNHPLTVALCFWLSRSGDGTNGTYDILPPGWGQGIDQAAIGTEEIELLRRYWLPGVKHHWLYFEPFALRDELVNLFKPIMCFSVPLLDDVLSVRMLRAPIPGEAEEVIDALTAVVAPPGWDAALSDVVGRVTMLSDYDPIEDAHRQEYIEEFQGPGTEAQEFYQTDFRSLETQARGQYSGNDSGARGFFGASLATGVEDTARRQFETFRDRYARPFPAVTIECSWKHLLVELGDLRQVTVPNVPNARTGGMGWTAEWCEVRGKRVIDARGTVALTVVQAPVSAVRLLAPGEVVTATAAGAIKVADAAGVFYVAGIFAAGDVIEVWTSDLLTSRGTATLTGVTDGGATLDLAMAVVPAGTTAGDVVTIPAYDTATASQRLRFAFLADAAATLGAGAAAANQYAT